MSQVIMAVFSEKELPRFAHRFGLVQQASKRTLHLYCEQPIDSNLETLTARNSAQCVLCLQQLRLW